MLKNNNLLEKLKTAMERKFKDFSKEDVIRKEKIIIDSKNEIEYSIIKSPRKYLIETTYGGIILTEDNFQLLNKNELKAVLLHEKGHVLFRRRYLYPLLPIILLALNVNSLSGVFFSAIIFFLFYIICRWLLELRCDLYAVKNSNKTIYVTALQKHYTALGYEISRLSITHPPLPIRIALLNYL
jgi:Zn-dependent protease with chaperone function